MESLEIVNEVLRNDALRCGICSDFYDPWEGYNKNRQELVKMFFAGLDFCIDHHFPQKEKIKKFFPADFLRKNNILVDDKFSLLNPRYAVLIGNSESTIRYNGITVAQLYLLDEAKAEVAVKGQAHVIIHVHDRAQVNIVECESPNKPMVIRNK